MTLRIGSLFSGYGGLDMAVESFFGAETEWFVEIDEAPSKILAHHWPGVPNLGDGTRVDWSRVEPVDIITGGTPCQDLSNAGQQQGMTEGTRSNLWVHMREAVATIRPKLVVWENVKGALSAKARSESDMESEDGQMGNLKALGRVLGDLTEIGYDAAWTTVRALDVGAPHHRARVFLIAWPNATDPRSLGLEAGGQPQPGPQEESGVDDSVVPLPDAEWGPYEPAIRRWETLTRPAPAPTEQGDKGKPRLTTAFAEWMMGLPAGHVTSPEIGLSRADQLKAIGNGVCPQQAMLALEILTRDKENASER